jgi:hypothetical protein
MLVTCLSTSNVRKIDKIKFKKVGIFSSPHIYSIWTTVLNGVNKHIISKEETCYMNNITLLNNSYAVTLQNDYENLTHERLCKEVDMPCFKLLSQDLAERMEENDASWSAG